MLRLSNTILTGVAAVALLASSAAFAQGGGLGGRITDAGTKLDQDVQACRPVNLGEYVQLLHEAAANKQRAEKMKKKGVPVDETQVNADLANASALFNRAQAALVGQCMRAAQQQQPQPKTTGALPGGPAPAVGLGGGGQSCTPAPTPAAASDGPRIPTSDEIRHIGDQMETAAEAGKQSEADYHLRSLDEMGAQLSKTISDAKKVGQFSNIDVKEAEKRLKQIEEWRKAGEKHRLPCPAAPAKPKSTALNLDNWARDVFAVHNATRNAVGSPPLQWREDLAQHAQARAEELAQAQQLIHAPREGRGTERENILQAPRGYTAAQEMGRWTREASDFVPGKFPEVSRTGNWMDVAHYTQMVSIQTTSIGCGHAMGGGFDWVVCRYDPGGNKDGKPILAEPGSQPQLVMREKEAPLPKTDTSRVHQTPMAQPQLDPSVLRWLAEEARRPWNEQHPTRPVSQPMTPPPESIFDDVGQTIPPPESILDDVVDATVPNSQIRPRMIGGDYGGTFNGVEWVEDMDLDRHPGWPGIVTKGGVDIDAIAGNDFGRPGELLIAGLSYNRDVFPTPAPFTVVLLGEQPAGPTTAHTCPADFGTGDLSRRLDQAEADLNKKLAAGEWIDPAEYEKLAAEAEQDKNAAAEADRAAGGGIDARPFLQNSDKAQRLLKSAKAAADKQTVDTKVEAPDVGGTPALIDPNAPSPIQLKLSDCVM